MGKCPHCGALIGSVNMLDMPMLDFHGKWKGVALVCSGPGCNRILSIQFDLRTLGDEIVRGVVAALSKG